MNIRDFLFSCIVPLYLYHTCVIIVLPSSEVAVLWGTYSTILQVVHRAEYWLPSEAALLRTPDSPLLSTATQTE
jgi:hypothetical protein